MNENGIENIGAPMILIYLIGLSILEDWLSLKPKSKEKGGIE
jgi:hypothetical protein